jgi:hypothetical protein
MKITTRNLGVGLLTAALLATGSQAALAFTISGTVRDQASVPVDGTELRLFAANGTPIGIPLILTNLAGSYTINGLTNGSYIVQFRPPTPDRLLAAELPANIVNANLTLNATLLPGHILSGFVRDVNGVGIASIDLQARDRDTGDMVLIPGDDSDLNGFYDVVLPTGEFDLEWRAVAPGLPPYIPVASREVIEADTVIDVTMVIGMHVSGRVATSGGAPVANVNLDFVDVATGIKIVTPGDLTAPDGTYHVQVPVGVYDVRAKPDLAARLVAQEVLSVAINAPMANLDFVLPTGVLLSGHTTRANGTGVAGVDIDVSDAVTGAAVFLPADFTDLAGLYQVIVPTGVLEVVFAPPTATLLAAVRNASVVVAGDLVLNATLPAGVLLSGTVTGNGVAVPATDIDVKIAATGVDVPLVGDRTNAQGTFAVVVVPGTYHVEVEPPRITRLVAQRILNLAVNSATNLPVALDSGMRVSGTVTAQGGGPVGNVDVVARRTSDLLEIFTPGDHTSALGLYEITIPAGNYRLAYLPDLAHADLDSLVLSSEVVSGDRVIDVVLPSSVIAVEDELPRPEGLELRPAQPNPFNPTTSISFDLGRPGRVRLSVHELDGRLVAVLENREFPAGNHAVRWNGTDDRGRVMSSGVYLVAVTAQGATRSQKVTLLK